MSSVKIVERERERGAFDYCKSLTDVKFGDKLERIEGRTFRYCTSLECIAIPLSNRIIVDDDAFYTVFKGCDNLKHVDLVGGVHETIVALPMEDWRNDMNAEIMLSIRFFPIHLIIIIIMRWGERVGQYNGGIDQFFANLLTTNNSTTIY